MNCDIDFRFVTRTLKDDYHVYANSGEQVLSDSIEFAPLRKKCGILPEDGGCTAIFEEDDKIFFVVSSVNSGRKDFAGRSIRFSFCKIFQSSHEKKEAYSSFIKIITQWENMQTEIQKLFCEKDQSVFFDEKEFINWLQDGTLPRNNLEICKHGDVRRVDENIWPLKNCILKWFLSENDEIFCHEFY
mgnify:CR=1 FL=1